MKRPGAKKKPAAARSSKGKPARPRSGGRPKTSPLRTRLLAELEASIKEIDEEGLLFLLKQANVLIHNARVDRLNQETEELEKKIKKPAAAARAGGAPGGVSIEDSPDGKAIFLVLGKTRKVMTPEEVKILVRICYGAETKSDALRQMFTVFQRERRDILVDAAIGNPAHPLLEGLFHAVRSAYRLEDR